MEKQPDKNEEEKKEASTEQGVEYADDELIEALDQQEDKMIDDGASDGSFQTFNEESF